MVATGPNGPVRRVKFRYTSKICTQRLTQKHSVDVIVFVTGCFSPVNGPKKERRSQKGLLTLGEPLFLSEFS
jgi:hypothetical protein